MNLFNKNIMMTGVTSSDLDRMDGGTGTREWMKVVTPLTVFKDMVMMDRCVFEGGTPLVQLGDGKFRYHHYSPVSYEEHVVTLEIPADIQSEFLAMYDRFMGSERMRRLHVAYINRVTF